MIPILFSEDATSFTTNGLGALSDVKSCVVTEERNGAFELEMEYPVDGIHFDDIGYSKIVYTKANQDQDAQAFRIYKISKPLNGLVTINAEHISYQLSYIPSGGFTATSCANALAGLKNNAYESCPFTFSTDNTTSGTYTQTLPRSIRSSLGGVDGSILDVFGGEYKWDNFTVYNLSARGSDNGVVLRYGKNITDITQEENIENTYTGVCPYWYSEESGMVTLSEHVLHASTAENFPFQRTVMLDMTESFEDAPTEDELRTAATTYMTNNNIGIPDVSIEVSFVNLADTEEYADVAPLESVGLCDYVHIYFEKLGVSATAKVVRTEYDSILERYNKIELGDAKSTFGDTIISAIQSTSSDKVSFTALENAVQRATSLITGNSGGYVRFVYNDDNLPEEILIMDTEDIDTATKVWRWNQNGLGYSSTGYDGTYALAMTQDGAIVADFITTGTLDASQATITNLDADNITSGTIDASQITVSNIDADNINTGTLNASNVEVTNLDADNITSGTLSADYINGGTITASGISIGDGAFVVNSSTGYLETMNFSDIGRWLRWGTYSESTSKFEIGVDQYSTTDNYAMTLRACPVGNQNSAIRLTLTDGESGVRFHYHYDTSALSHYAFAPYGGDSVYPLLGTSSYPWGKLYTKNIIYGTVSLTPGSAGATVSTTVSINTDYYFSSTPMAYVTAKTSVPGNVSVGVSCASDSLTIYMYRTTATTTSLCYLVVF